MKKAIYNIDSSIKRHFVFIINPISGTNKNINYEKIISTHFAQESFEIKFTKYRSHATEIALDFAEESTCIVVAVGGDGTINEIAKSLVNKPAKLGIIPAGSGNGFGGHLLNNKNIVNCLNVLKSKRYILSDLILINNEICCNTTGIGLSAYVAKIFDEEGKRGLLNYMKLGFGEFSKFPTFDLKIDNKEYLDKLSVEIANSSQLGNNAFISPNSSVQDGLVETVLLSKPTFFQVPSLLYDVFNKRLNSNKLIQNMSSATSYISLPFSNHLHIDGEYKGMVTDIKIHVLPLAIKIMV